MRDKTNYVEVNDFAAKITEKTKKQVIKALDFRMKELKHHPHADVIIAELQRFRDFVRNGILYKKDSYKDS